MVKQFLKNISEHKKYYISGKTFSFVFMKFDSLVVKFRSHRLIYFEQHNC